MKTKPSNPPMLAMPNYTGEDQVNLRDIFAIRALQGMLSSPPVVNRFTVNKKKWVAIAYEWADAMLTERAKP